MYMPINNALAYNNTEYVYMEKYFTKVAGVDMSLLQISDVGKYSVSKPIDAAEINRLITQYFSKPKSIIVTDATANNGGNTIKFAIDFKYVNSVEISPEQFSILSNNVHVYNLQNVKLINVDYLKIMQELRQDVIFIDAPWGGPEYKKNPKVDLFLGRRNIHTVVKDIIEHSLCSLCVLKAPINYNYQGLFSKLPNTKFDVYTINNYVIICIPVNMREPLI
jgi:hypothetical protein